MNEYVTGAEFIQTLEVIFPMILFSLFVSMLVFIHWVYLFLIELIDIVYEGFDKRKAKVIASNDVAKNV